MNYVFLAIIYCEVEKYGKEALKYIDLIKNNFDAVIITGSLYLLGDVRHYFNN